MPDLQLLNGQKNNMPVSYRFGDYQSELGASHRTISANRFFPKLEKDPQGHVIPHKRKPIKLKSAEKLVYCDPIFQYALS